MFLHRLVDCGRSNLCEAICRSELLCRPQLSGSFWWPLQEHSRLVHKSRNGNLRPTRIVLLEKLVVQWNYHEINSHSCRSCRRCSTLHWQHLTYVHRSLFSIASECIWVDQEPMVRMLIQCRWWQWCIAVELVFGWRRHDRIFENIATAVLN